MRIALLSIMLVSWVAILVGGSAWVWGRLRGAPEVRLWGERLASIGLCVDGLLLLAYWIFHWRDLL